MYRKESLTVARDVREWAASVGGDPRLRVALCGYEGEHDLPGWDVYAWKTVGGYGGQSLEENVNTFKERIWFSPHCLSPRRTLF